MKIYVVEGCTGEYDDYCNWPVKAFREEDNAKAFEAALNNKAKELGISTKGTSWDKKGQAIVAEMQKLDARVSVDYTGVQYSFYELELE
jgi:hypothetical protein